MNYDDRIILHCDINNFFASVECIDKPHLKNMPVAVSGDAKKRNGIILAKNEIAKKYGVQTGEAIWQAKQKCPNLICLSPHHKLYEKVSRQIIEIYKCYTDQIEPFGIDECWLDLTTCTKLFPDPVKVANEIRQRIKNEIGVTASVGVSFCKLFAKLASDMKKPDATTIINYNNFKKIIYPLPINSIIGIGKRMEKRLLKMNISTLGALAYADPRVLSTSFGVVGVRLKEKLLGFDFDPVANIDEPQIAKSVGNGTTTIKDINTEQEVKQTLQFLACSVAKRLREQNFVCSCVGVTIKNASLNSIHREKSISFSSNDEIEICKYAMSLVKEFWDFTQPIRAIRLRCSSLTQLSSYQQTNFLNMLSDKTSRLNSAIDFLNKKYNCQIVKLAAITNSDFINPSFL